MLWRYSRSDRKINIKLWRLQNGVWRRVHTNEARRRVAVGIVGLTADYCLKPV